MLAFAAALKKSGNAERSVATRFSYVYTFLKRNGKAGILAKTEWPRYFESESDFYSEVDVKKMLDACRTCTERTLILFVSGTAFGTARTPMLRLTTSNFPTARFKPAQNHTGTSPQKTVNSASSALLAIRTTLTAAILPVFLVC